MPQVRIKVRGGSIKDGDDPLCLSCAYAHRIRGSAMRQQVIHCSLLDQNVTFDVHECNRYRHANHPGLADMNEIAWILKTDPQRKKIGFVPMKKLSEKEQRESRVWEDE